MKRLDVCSGKLEEGAFRIDSNISVHKSDEPLGTRVELKNLNSFKFIDEAINYEINRQKELLYLNQKVINETRHYNFKNKTTYSLRDKEIIQDYRFMPEPNLIPLRIYKDKEDQLQERKSQPIDECAIYLDTLKQEIPKLPKDERDFLIKTYNLTLDQVYRLFFTEGFYQMFNYLMDKNQYNHQNSPTKLVNFITIIVNSFLVERNREFRRINIPYDYFDECYNLLLDDRITEGTVIELLNVKFDELSSVDKSANEYLTEYGWSKIEDQEFVRNLVRETIQRNLREAKKYQTKQNRHSFNRLVESAYFRTKRTVPQNIIKHVIDEILLVNKEEINLKTDKRTHKKNNDEKD